MNILIVDDDSIKISKVVSFIKSTVKEEIYVETAVDIVGALRFLKRKKFDLCVVDICLPVRYGDDPNNNGGKNLVLEIERNKELESPVFLVGLTQYEACLGQFPSIWNVYHYSSNNEWKEELSRLLSHIQKTWITNSDLNSTKPKLYVEGKSDKKIFTETINLFYPEYFDLIDIESDRNAGATWVANQVIAVSHSQIEGSKQRIKVFGLLDGDVAGQEARKKINQIIPSDSAMRSFFKIVNLSADHARHLIPIIKKGVVLPITLEELFPSDIWNYAEKKGWLIDRNITEFKLKNPNEWDQRNQGFSEYLENLDLTTNEINYISKVDKFRKEDLVNYILGLDEYARKKALLNFEPLTNEIIKYLINKDKL